MGYNFLIVDDSEVARSLLKKLIAISGMPSERVYEAKEGGEALDLLSKNWIDLVLTDLHMDGMDGLEMLNIMNQDDVWRAIPVVVVSSDRGKEPQAVKQGARAFLVKPVAPEVFRKAMFSLLGSPSRKTPDALSSAILASVAAGVFEKAAFMFSEPIITREGTTNGPVISAILPLNETQRLVLNAPYSLGAEAAENFLGAETENLPVSTISDAWGELCNIIGGVLLERTGMKRSGMMVPRVEILDRPPRRLDEGAVRCASFLRVEEKHLLEILISEGSREEA